MDITILGIESSCDDTSAAVLRGNVLLSNVIASQAVHVKYGGVIPELASRAHQQNIIPVVVRAAEGGGGVEHPLRRTDSLVGLAANAAGHQNVIVLAVIVRPQDAAAAGAFDLGVRRFQRKYGAGTHYLRTAFRADIAQSSHIISHRGLLV